MSAGVDPVMGYPVDVLPDQRWCQHDGEPNRIRVVDRDDPNRFGWATLGDVVFDDDAQVSEPDDGKDRTAAHAFLDRMQDWMRAQPEVQSSNIDEIDRLTLYAFLSGFKVWVQLSDENIFTNPR